MCKVLGTRNSTTRIKKIKPSVLSMALSEIKTEEGSASDINSELYELIFAFSNEDKFEGIREKEVS